jgi:YidC/Oxa1 family membrane protein insertase
MADELKGTSGASGGGKFELTMEMRLLLAFGLMGIVLFATQYFMPKPAKPAQAPAQKQEQAQASTAEPTATPTPAPEVAVTPMEPTAAAQEETHTIETDVYKVVFSNHGAVVRSWVLKKYKDGLGQPVELVTTNAAARAGWPFSYVFPRQKPATDLNKVRFTVTQKDALSIEFTYADATTSARKSFQFDAKGYRTLLHSEVASGGKGVDHHVAWRGGFGDRTAHNASEIQKSVYYDGQKSKLVEEGPGAGEKGPVTVAGAFHFAGIEDTFFANVALPAPGETLEFSTWSDKFAELKGAEEKRHVGASFGGRPVLDAVLFVGPKDTNILRSTDPKLETMIDWGWFWFIAKPLFFSLQWTVVTLTNNWGWAIIFVTVVINLLMLPMKFSQLRSSKKMAAAGPEIQAVNNKYKGISMKDPRKQKQNEEIMAVYQKHGINPMGGCLPLLLQMPFFIAFYKVLSVAIELRGAQWAWIADLSQPETLVIRALPVAMLVTQIWMQKMTPMAGGDPAQQKMMMFMMPVMMGIFFYSAFSGLVLYWLTGNVVGIVQQYFFNQAASRSTTVSATTTKKK